MKLHLLQLQLSSIQYASKLPFECIRQFYSEHINGWVERLRRWSLPMDDLELSSPSSAVEFGRIAWLSTRE